MANEGNFYTILTLDRSRRRWRFGAFLLLLILMFMGFSQSEKLQQQQKSEYVASVDVTGFIGEDRQKDAILQSIANDDMAKALVVYVDSPGGTMVGGLSLYNSLRRVAQKKPVVVHMGTVAASAGYMVALGGDYIIANEATLTGSIGVFMPLVDARGLADKIGIKDAAISSGDLKMITSPLAERDKAAQKYLEGMVDDLEGIFLSYVKERRQPDVRTLELVKDGRTLIGLQAKELGLVDALGDAYTARAWLANTHKIGSDVPVKYIELNEPQGFLEKALTQAGIFPTFLGHNSMMSGIWAVQR